MFLYIKKLDNDVAAIIETSLRNTSKELAFCSANTFLLTKIDMGNNWEMLAEILIFKHKIGSHS